MAYVTNDAYRAYPAFARQARVRSPGVSLFTRSMMVALCVGVAVVSWSAGDLSSAENRVGLKGERLAVATIAPSSQHVVTDVSAGGERVATYVNDAVNRTTSVSKGAVTSLSADSPYATDARR